MLLTASQVGWEGGKGRRTWLKGLREQRDKVWLVLCILRTMCADLGVLWHCQSAKLNVLPTLSEEAGGIGAIHLCLLQ